MDGKAEKRLVIIQCDSGHTNGDLIACARYRIYDLRADVRDMDEQQVTHVLFIIHLPHQVISSSFVGFQGSPWISSHIDDLRPTTDNSVSASEAIGLSISELFFGAKAIANTDKLDQQQLPEAELPPRTYNEDDVEITFDFSIERRDERSRSEEMPSEPESEGRSQEGLEFGESMETENKSSSQAEESMLVVDIEDEAQEYEDVRAMHLDDQRPASQLSDSIVQENNEGIVPNELSSQGPSLNLSHAEALSPAALQQNVAVMSGQYNEPLANRSPLYCRLHGCIQAAASKLKDITIKRSTKRVEILVQLIPREPSKDLGKVAFL